MITELHVKGATQLNTSIPPELRGTYLGLCHPEMIHFFNMVGIKKIQLMPVFEFEDESHLKDKGLTNYWGYNPTSWLMPTKRYAYNPDDVEAEFQVMVDTLHVNGIRVILDVVYNHVGESVRHNYRHLDDDLSGCGATIDATYHADDILASLLHWRRQYRVDGFRFDLATTLGHDSTTRHFDPYSPLLARIRNHPDLQGCQLIAEPWSCKDYCRGQFPAGYHEQNGVFRDTVREFFNLGGARTGQLADAIAGHRHDYRGWAYHAPINMVTCHDGFTLEDLVSYDTPLNEANGEDNRDGEKHNRSTDHCHYDPDMDVVLQRRAQVKRNMMSVLFFSIGEPHILFADLFSHSQGGNNNAYCQDNPVSWVNWNLDTPAKQEFLWFMIRTIALHHAVMPALMSDRDTTLQFDWTGTDWEANNGINVKLFNDNVGVHLQIDRDNVKTNLYNKPYVTYLEKSEVRTGIRIVTPDNADA